MTRGPKKNVCVLMPVELYGQVKAQADKSGRSTSSYVRQVLRRYLWHVENAPETLTEKWEIT